MPAEAIDKPSLPWCGLWYTVLQRWFAEYEFSTRYLLCCSDCEPMALKELLALADDDSLARYEHAAGLLVLAIYCRTGGPLAPRHSGFTAAIQTTTSASIVEA